MYQDNIEQKSLMLFKQKFHLMITSTITVMKGRIIKYQQNEPLFDEIQQLSKYIIEYGKKPVSSFENTVKPCFGKYYLCQIILFMNQVLLR